MRVAQVACIAVCVVGYSGAASAGTRLSEYGTNPYLSWTLFPQDLPQLQANQLSFFPSYEKKPYWGRIDDPAAKPNGTYTSTGLDYEAGDGAKFDHSAAVRSITNSIAYAPRLRSGPVTSFKLDYDIDDRSNKSAGTFIDDSSNQIPFDYSMVHALNRLHGQGAIGFAIRGAPVGIRLRGGFENSLFLNHDFTFTKGDSTYSTDRTTWGWASNPCAHIFGARGVEGDAWLQDGYAMGPMFDAGVLAGITLPRAKVGVQLDYRTGHQGYYGWIDKPDSVWRAQYAADSSLDTTLMDNFDGSYEKSDWSKQTNDAIIQVYSNVTLKKSDRFALNTFVRLGYQGLTRSDVLDSNRRVEGGDKEQFKSAFLELGPNVQIPFGSVFSYIDVGIPISYAYSRFDNKYMRWVGGGQIETHRDTETDATDENSWQGFSYANRSVFDVGLDLNTMFPLLNTERRKLGLGVQLLLSGKFMFMTKFYGHNIDQGSQVSFEVDRKRKDFERDIQFATGLKLQYQRRPFLAWFELTEPLLHSQMPRTRVIDASSKETLFEHQKSPLWMSLQGLRVGLYLSVEVNPSSLRAPVQVPASYE